MPNSRDDENRDAMDAISASELLKKLKGGIEASASDDKNENVPKKASIHISDTAAKAAEAELIKGEPDEFGDDLEALLRSVMNMPADEDKTASSNDNENPEMQEVAPEPVSSDGAPESDEQTVSEVSGDNADVTLPEAAEVTDDPDDGDDSDPWYEDEEEALSRPLTAHEAVRDTVVDDKTEGWTDVPNTDHDDDDGFLGKIIGDISNGVAGYCENDEEDDEFEFVTDSVDTDRSQSKSDEVAEAASDSEAAEKNDNADKSEPMPDRGYVSDEDGAKEYTGLDGAEFDSTEFGLIALFGGKRQKEEQKQSAEAQEIINEAQNLSKYKAPRKKHFFEMFDEKYEYTDRAQNGEIEREYASAFRSKTIGFFACLVFALLLFVFENANLFGITLPNVLNISVYPVIYSMVDLQLVVLCALTAFDRLGFGIYSLFKLKFVPESVPAILLAASVAYTSVMMNGGGIKGARLYNFPVAAAMVLLLAYELMHIKSEAMGFAIASSGKAKFAVTETAEAKGSEGFSEYLPDDAKKFSVVRASRIDGFFKRIREREHNRKHIVVMFALTIAEALLALAFGLFMKYDTCTVATIVYLTVILALPGSIMLTYSLPLYRASKNACASESAILGEGAVNEYTDSAVVYFDDRDIFPAAGVKIGSVKVYGDNRIDRVIRDAASVFSVIGGPLKDVFELATIDIGHSSDVRMLDRDDDGLHVQIDGVGTYIGGNDYMKRLGFETPYGDKDLALEQNTGSRIMYIASEEEILAKFTVQYTADLEYELIFKQLYKAGICIGIRTLDPNIGDGLVMKKLKLKENFPVKVVRADEKSPESEANETCVDSGVISIGSVKALLKALSQCDRVKYITKVHGVFGIVSAVLALVAVYAVTLFGKLDIGSAYAALYQLFWMIPMLAAQAFSE